MADPSHAILIVDDDEFNRTILSRGLAREGYANVNESDNGRDALAILRQRPFDLVLLDVMMPGMDGYEVLKIMKSDMALRDVPVVMISALDDTESVVRCVELGAEDYLPKPFNPTLLRARIGASLARKGARDQEAAYLQMIETEKKLSEEMLRGVLPPGAIRELRATNEVRPRRYESVAVLFCDIVGFTAYCDSNPPEKAIAELQALVERFEIVVARHGLEKIKTSGDALLATAGLLQEVDDPLGASVRCGLDLVRAAADTAPHWGVRVGIHYGPVIAGVIGRRQFLFDLWGDTVNVAARIMQCAGVNSVCMSTAIWMRIRHRCAARSQGVFDLKGKGRVEIVQCLDIAPEV